MTKRSGKTLESGYRFLIERIQTKLREYDVESNIDGLRLSYGALNQIILRRKYQVTNDLGETKIREEQNFFTPWMSADQIFSGDALAIVDRNIKMHARRVLRQQAAADHVKDEIYPAWSYTVDRLAYAFFQHLNIDLSLAINGKDSLGYKAFTYFCENAGLTAQTVNIIDGYLQFGYINIDNIHYHDDNGPLLVVEQEVPETLVDAMTGRLLSDIVDNPIFKTSKPVRIKYAENRLRRLVLHLDNKNETIGRVPPGIDKRWTKIPYIYPDNRKVAAK